MTDLELIKEMYNGYSRDKADHKHEWFVEYILDIATYDAAVDEYFYNYCIPVVKEWVWRVFDSRSYRDKTSINPFKEEPFDFAWDAKAKRYIQYLTVSNLMPAEFIEWGTSIRTAWWNEPEIFITNVSISNKDYIKRDGKIKLTADLMVDIFNWLEEN